LSSSLCCSFFFFFSLAYPFAFIATFLFFLSSSFRAFSASVASSYRCVVLLAVETMSSLLSVSCKLRSSELMSMGFTPPDPPLGSIPYAVKSSRGNLLRYHL
jgi:hypothetical protein